MIIFKIVFTLIGSIFLSIGIWFYTSDAAFMKTAQKTEGVVIEAGRIPIIMFYDQNNKTIEYSPNMSCDPPCYHMDEKVTIYYNLENPHDAMIDSFSSRFLFPLIFGILGGIFFIIGLGFIIFPILKKNKQQYLMLKGIQIETTFVDINKNYSVTMNRRNPYIITSEWHEMDTNTVYSFISDNIWFNPEKYIPESNSIIVYIEHNNPKKYYMDISFLPKKG